MKHHLIPRLVEVRNTFFRAHNRQDVEVMLSSSAEFSQIAWGVANDLCNEHEIQTQHKKELMAEPSASQPEAAAAAA